MAEECGFGHHSGFMDVTDIKLSPNDIAPEVRAKIATAFPAGPTHQSIVNPLLTKLSKTKMREYNDKLSSYHTRYYTTTTGKQAAEWIYNEFLAQKVSPHIPII